MNKLFRRLAVAALLPLCALISPGAQAQTGTRAVGAFIAPPELMAAYACSTYASAVFMPIVQERAKATVKSGANARATLTKVLQDYDKLLVDMCNEVRPIFMKNREKVLDVYAQQLPGSERNAQALTASADARRWSLENAEFLIATAGLGQQFELVAQVAPDLLDWPLFGGRAPLWRISRDINDEVRATSAGKTAAYERTRLIQLLSDRGFAQLAPKRYDLVRLAGNERRLRLEAARLMKGPPFMEFNSNASDLIRMHFDGFDVMREMGLAPIYTRYGEKAKLLGR